MENKPSGSESCFLDQLFVASVALFFLGQVTNGLLLLLPPHPTSNFSDATYL